MQSATRKRLLSTFAAKIHPQAPLTPRESKQLLSLLTTSFRAHLEREHPLSFPETAQWNYTQGPISQNGRRFSSTADAASSYASTTRHIDSILTNPLFAVKPRRRGSDHTAVDMLRDPMSWFLNEIALGTADLRKAFMCMEMLGDVAPQTSVSSNGLLPQAIMAEWLQSSGMDSSRQFVNFCLNKSEQGNKFLWLAVRTLMGEGTNSAPWVWFTRPNAHWEKETGCDASRIVKFKQQLLSRIVQNRVAINLDTGLHTFLRALTIVEKDTQISSYTILRPAGAYLVNRIASVHEQSLTPELYEAFLVSAQQWLGAWSAAVEATLWLYHPTRPTALVGLEFIQDPVGAITYTQSSQSRRHFVVQLCLGVSRQLLEEEKYEEAQRVMKFTQDNFADIVLPEMVQETLVDRNERIQKDNLQLLDSLMLS